MLYERCNKKKACVMYPSEVACNATSSKCIWEKESNVCKDIAQCSFYDSSLVCFFFFFFFKFFYRNVTQFLRWKLFFILFVLFFLVTAEIKKKGPTKHNKIIIPSGVCQGRWLSVVRRRTCVSAKRRSMQWKTREPVYR